MDILYIYQEGIAGVILGRLHAQGKPISVSPTSLGFFENDQLRGVGDIGRLELELGGSFLGLHA